MTTSKSFTNSMSDEIIISSLPKRNQKKAKILIDHLKTHKKQIDWDEAGNVFINGEKIKNSNIIDLINDAARHRKKFKSVGRKEFAALLRSIDTPKEFIGNSELWKLGTSSFLNSKYEDDDDDDDDDDDNGADGSAGSTFQNTVDSEGESSFFGNKSGSGSLSSTVVLNKSSGKRHTSTPIPKNNKKWNRIW